MPRLVPSSPSSSSVREQIIEKIRKRRDLHPLWPEWTMHYDYEIALWESGSPMWISGWQLPPEFRQRGHMNDRLVVEGDGTIRPRLQSDRSD